MKKQKRTPKKSTSFWKTTGARRSSPALPTTIRAASPPTRRPAPQFGYSHAVDRRSLPRHSWSAFRVVSARHRPRHRPRAGRQHSRKHYPRLAAVWRSLPFCCSPTPSISPQIIGAMGDARWSSSSAAPARFALQLLSALVSLALQIFIPFPRYVTYPEMRSPWRSSPMSGTSFVVHIRSGERSLAADACFHTGLISVGNYVAMVVAVFGTTISPYLFFWQASQEVEEQRAAKGEKPLKAAPQQAPEHLQRIQYDTYIGMGVSNVVAFSIMLTAIVTLHLHGVTNIQTSAEAARALRPVAGDFAFALFAAGIIGTGLLAVPVLAGSAAYAVAETLHWRIGLGRPLMKARGFYSILTVATLLVFCSTSPSIDPIKALFYSAVVNGVIALPIMAVVMLLAVKPVVMGAFVISRRLRILGWLATTVMERSRAGDVRDLVERTWTARPLRRDNQRS